MDITQTLKQLASLLTSLMMVVSGTVGPANTSSVGGEVLGVGTFSVTPSVADVTSGQKVKFSASVPVTWSLAPGSQGSIAQDGTYTAPSNIKAKQKIHGCQVLPNNHIFNTKVDNLPVHADSAAWLGQSGASSGSINYLRNYSFNIIDSKTAQQNLVFAYTPQNNGPFRVLGWPEAKQQGGWFSGPFGLDRHLFSVDPNTCQAEEIYNLYQVGVNPSCPTCNSQSGTKFSLNSYDLAKGGTDAAGMQILPLTLRAQEFQYAVDTGGSINHAIRFTMPNAVLARSFIWPATTNAYAGGGLMPYGARFRLKSSFNESNLSPAAKVLARQLKEYGIIMSDGGLLWQIPIDDGYLRDDLKSALNEIRSSVRPDSLEAVDTSSLMVSSSSGETNTNGEIVIATDSSGNTVSAKVVLKGTTLGIKENKYIVQAGSPGFTIPHFLGTAASSGVVWSLNSGVGSISSSGVYTPPATLSSAQTIKVKVASIVDPSVFEEITLVILPPGIMRFSRETGFGPDSQGNTWMPFKLLEQAGWFYPATVNTTPDAGLYSLPYNYFDDQYYEIYLPNGDYRITGKFIETSGGSSRVKMHLEAQGNIIYRDVDLYETGGIGNPIDFVLPAKVQNGKLQFVLRKISGYVTKISSLKIEPDTGSPGIQVSPQNSSQLKIGDSRQFYALLSNISNQQVVWTASPVGTIDSNGLYKAPLSALASDTVITVSAQSVSNPELKADSTFILKGGVPDIRINSGGVSFTDALGRVWAGDSNYSGTSYNYGSSNQISGATSDIQKLYQSARYNYHWQPKFEYTFPVANGNYSIKLHWADYSGTDPKIKMDVKINSSTVLTDFDPIAAAGGVLTAYSRTFETQVSNNQIKIEFIPKPTTYIGAYINGIEIVFGSSGSTTPPPTPIPTTPPPPVVDTTPPTISNITTSEITTNSATVTWTTNEPADSQIEYGLTSAYGAFAIDGTPATNHVLKFTNLSPNTKYNYRVTSEDLAGNTTVSSNQIFTTKAQVATTPTPPPTPPTTVVTGALADWSYRKILSINKSQIQGSHSNFPLLVSLVDNDLKSASNGGKVAKNDGSDLVFADSNNTKLSHEIEKYDSTTGQLIAWVKVPSISSSADTNLSLYFGNSQATDQQNATGVWDSNYLGVWHMGDGDNISASFYQDSTLHGQDLTLVDDDGDSDQITGQIGNAYSFNGDADYMYAPTNALKPTDQAFTMSAWVRMANSSDDDPIFYWDDSSGGSYVLYAKDGGSNDRPYIQIRTASGAGSASVNYAADSTFVNDTWYYMVGTYDGSNMRVYHNTIEDASAARTGNMSYAGFGSQRLLFFKASGAKYREGEIDEARISNIARSSDWIKTEYNNQSNPTSFISASATESTKQIENPPKIQETFSPPPPPKGPPSVTFSSIPSVIYGSSGGGGGSTSVASGIKTTNTTTTAISNTMTTMNTGPISLPRDLVFGAKGNDVTTLQTTLVSLGYLSSDSATGYFGPLTLSAIKKYQQDKGLAGPGDRGWGNVGPQTRAHFAKLSGTTTSNSTLTPTQKAAIQAQINSLLALVAKLMAQLQALRGR